MKARAVIAIVVFLVILTSPFLVNIASGGLFQENAKPDLTYPQAGVRMEDEPDPMRKKHMKLLKEERDQVVRHGERTAKYKLENCFICHDKREEFCDRCHEFVGVKPGCFDNAGGCHESEQR